MRRLIDAIKRNPLIASYVISGAVAILGVTGILSAPIAALLQGALSIALAVALAAVALTARQVIRKMQRKETLK